MFRPMSASSSDRVVVIKVDGRLLSVRAGQSLALALMEADVVPLRRSAVSGEPRAPLCMMGVCFECLVEVDGRQNVQSCMIEVADGMSVRLQVGVRKVSDAI